MFFLVFPYSDMFSALACISVTEVESTSIFVIFSTFLFFPLMYIYLYISHFSVYKGRAKSVTRQK